MADVVHVGYFWGYAWWRAFLCIDFWSVCGTRTSLGSWGVFHRASTPVRQGCRSNCTAFSHNVIRAYYSELSSHSLLMSSMGKEVWIWGSSATNICREIQMSGFLRRRSLRPFPVPPESTPQLANPALRSKTQSSNFNKTRFQKPLIPCQTS